MDPLTCEHRGLRFTLRHLDTQRTQFVVERISDGHILTSRLCEAAAADRFAQLVDAWIDDRLGVNPPPKVHCAACASVLAPAMGTDTTYQFDNALWVTFSGGYGMFVDPFDEDDPKTVICHACAHALCESQPWVAELLQPQRSHAHRIEDIPALLAAGHTGWDLDRHSDD